MKQKWILLAAVSSIFMSMANLQAADTTKSPARKTASNEEQFYSYYLVQCDYTVRVRDADQAPEDYKAANKNEYTDVQVYISKKPDTKYSPDSIGKDLVEVYFRGHPASASLIVDLCKRKLAKSAEERLVSISATKDTIRSQPGFYYGTTFSSWPEK